MSFEKKKDVIRDIYLQRHLILICTYTRLFSQETVSKKKQSINAQLFYYIREDYFYFVYMLSKQYVTETVLHNESTIKEISCVNETAETAEMKYTDI